MTSAFHQEHPDAALTRTPAPPKPLAKRRRYCSIKPRKGSRRGHPRRCGEQGVDVAADGGDEGPSSHEQGAVLASSMPRNCWVPSPHTRSNATPCRSSRRSWVHPHGCRHQSLMEPASSLPMRPEPVFKVLLPRAGAARALPPLRRGGGLAVQGHDTAVVLQRVETPLDGVTAAVYRAVEAGWPAAAADSVAAVLSLVQLLRDGAANPALSQVGAESAGTAGLDRHHVVGTTTQPTQTHARALKGVAAASVHRSSKPAAFRQATPGIPGRTL